MSKKRGHKRGTNFARYTLQDMTDQAKTICNAAKSGSLNATKVATAVLGAKGFTSTAGTKIAALRHYGLLEGPNKDLKPTDICRELPLAQDGPRVRLLRDAFLSCKPFRAVYDNYADAAKQSRSNIGTYATIEVGVNSENEEEFLNVFVEGLQYAQLGELSGDEIEFHEGVLLQEQPAEGEEETADEESLAEGDAAASTIPMQASKPGAVVDIKIDSTLDPDKLEKQLAVLRKYGLV